jgi:hypothetical protein
VIYEYIKDFRVGLIDNAGFVEKENAVNIRKGSMWKIDMTAVNNMTGAELRLENLTGLEWIEISKKRLDAHFIKQN